MNPTNVPNRGGGGFGCNPLGGKKNSRILVGRERFKAFEGKKLRIFFGGCFFVGQ